MEAWVQIIPYIKHDRDKLNLLFTCKELYALLDATVFRGTYVWHHNYPFTDVTWNIKKFKFVVTRGMCINGVFRGIIPPQITYLKCLSGAAVTYIHSGIRKLQYYGIFTDNITTTQLTHVIRGCDDLQTFYYVRYVSPKLRKVTLGKECEPKVWVLDTNTKCLNIKSRCVPNDSGTYWSIPEHIEHVILSTPKPWCYIIHEEVKYLTINCNISDPNAGIKRLTYSYLHTIDRRHVDDFIFMYNHQAHVRFTKKFTMGLDRIHMPYITHVRFSNRYTQSIYLWVPKSVVWLKYRGNVYVGQEIDQFR